MKNRGLIFILILILSLTIITTMIACGKKDEPGDETGNTTNGDDLLVLTGISFSDLSLDFDGAEKELLVSGLPEGATVVYTGNKGTTPGVYQASATISKEGYGSITLNASLTIRKLNFTGLTFEDVTMDYTGEKTVLSVSGTIPEGAEVTYTANEGTAVGVYNASVTITKDNYNDFTADAVLTINKLNFTGLTFEDVTIDYDGYETELGVIGNIPEGAVVTYTTNKGKEVGVYNASVTITKDNYNDFTADAVLTINKRNFTGLTFEDVTIDYTGNEIELGVTGNIPEGAVVTYTTNKGTNAGVYNASVTITKDNYNDFTDSAVLTINKANFTGITFANKTVTYDSNEQSILASGLPGIGESVVYTTNTGTDAGVYNASVTITKDNYNAFTASAVLTISKATLSQENFSFSGLNVEYDMEEHFINITGLVPNGESVIYTGGENGSNAATNVGTYDIVATIGGKNYVAITLNATIKITSKEEPLTMTLYNGEIYFQNNLDNKYIYKMTTEGAIEKVSSDIPEQFVQTNSVVYYLSKNLFSRGIVKFDGTDNKDLFSVNGEYLATDGTYLYYANNSIFSSENNGIYRVSIADLENENVDPVPTKLTSALKAEYLVYANNKIYFSNKSDGGKLYRVGYNDVGQPGEKVYDYKVSDIVFDGTCLFFTRHITLSNFTPGAAIYSINVSAALTLPLADEATEIEKITNSKGKYLNIVGDYIYFVNTDKAITTIFGDGIYKAKKDGTDWLDDVIGGTKMVDGETDKVYALSTDGTNIYYYRANNKHLYKYDFTEEVDLMAGYIPPEEDKTISTYYEDMEQYEGELYFINMRDKGRLYKYNVDTDSEFRITNLQVADIAINASYMYFATVRFGVNYDLYKMDLETGVAERISFDKCYHLAFTEDKIYYANYSGNNTLNRMNLDGTGNEILYEDKDVDDWNIEILDGKVYFVAGNDLYYYSITSSTVTIVPTELKPNEYSVIGNDIYLLHDDWKNTVVRYKTSDSSVAEIADLGPTNDARSFFVIGNYFYFYRNVAAGSSNKGLYVADMTSATPTAQLVHNLTYTDPVAAYYMSNAQVINGKVYFLDVWQFKNNLPTGASTGNLCVLELSTNTVTVLSDTWY